MHTGIGKPVLNGSIIINNNYDSITVKDTLDSDAKIGLRKRLSGVKSIDQSFSSRLGLDRTHGLL